MGANSQNPKVTVLMLVYNRENCLPDSIESVLNQTFQDFELLIVDDGSTDQSVSVINKYRDPRIRLIQNGVNRGIVYSRNKGISEARGLYTAVLDSDDIAAPDRLEEQVGFLDANPDFGMVASWLRVIDSNGSYLNERNVCKARPEEIPAELLFHNVFAHSSITVRTEILQKYRYSSDFPMAEDYELFVRIAENHKSRHIPKMLTLYRKHSENISDQKKTLMDKCVGKIVGGQLQRLGINYCDEELKLHLALGEYKFSSTPQFIEAAEKWLSNIKQKNDVMKIYNQVALDKVIGRYWFQVMYASSAKGIWSVRRFHSSGLAKLYKTDLGARDILKYLFFIGKCFIKR